MAINSGLKDRIHNCQESIEVIAGEIALTRDRVSGERASALAELTRVRQAAQQTEAEVERIKAQISTREAPLAGLSNRTITRDFGPLGKMVAPDPAARSEAGATLVEIAGLRAALASAEATAAATRQSVDAFELELDHVPVDADPRVILLYSKLEAQRKTLGTLTQQALTILTTSVERVLSEDNQRAIARLASQKIKTPLPNDVEADLFYDAIEKVEAALVDAIPRRALEMIKQTAGGDADQYVARLTKKLNKDVDIPMLGEDEEGVFFELVVRLLIDAMKSGNTIDGLLNGHGPVAPMPRLVESPATASPRTVKKVAETRVGTKRARNVKKAKRTKKAKKAKKARKS